MNDKLIISLPELAKFIDLLEQYGQARDHISIENSAIGLKAFFCGEDEFLKKDFKDFSGGVVEYKET